MDKVLVSDRLDFRRLHGGTPARPNRQLRQRREGEMFRSCGITPTKLTLQGHLPERRAIPKGRAGVAGHNDVQQGGGLLLRF